jgi:hypothetical protein
MLRLAETLLSASPVAAAALLLVARHVGHHLGLPAPDVAQILAATKVSRSAAYELAPVLADLLPTLARPRGRPPKPPAAAPADETAALTHAVLAFVLRHPGCARAGVRRGYSDRFRHFILEQRAVYAALDVEVFARAVHVPLGTLKDWLHAPTTPAQEPAASAAAPEGEDAQMAQIQTVLAAYAGWAGTFVDFCEHLQLDLHLSFGRALVAHILDAHGVRHVQRRGRRTSDELAMRGAFRTFFPGAQWVGDGMQVPVVIDGQRFFFNLELDVDAYSGAFVGVSVRDNEDAAAVVEALEDGACTAGALPLALLLDNKPSNHTPEIDAALGDAIRIRATTERPQNKAHVEGAFGLFSQILPPLVLDTHKSSYDIARAFLGLVITVWGRTTNHRPRADRDGRSRVDLYADVPSLEQIDHARRDLRELAARQDRARRTLEARRRPDVLALLDEHFARLSLLDPERHIRLTIAGYPLDAILGAIAIFDGKRRAATLPDGADARYLLGIVKNVATTSEGEHIAHAMLALRLAARDRMLAGLVHARDVVCSQADLTRVCSDCVDRALETTSTLDRAFWLRCLSDVLLRQPEALRHDHFLAVARRIYASFAVPPRERQDAVRVLAERLVPLA